MVTKVSTPITFNFGNIDHSQSIVDYAHKRMQKHKFSNLEVQFGTVNIKRDHETGVNKYSVSFDLTVKGQRMHFKESGNDIFVMIDLINDKMKTRLSKLKSVRNYHKMTSVGGLF